jgi:aldehyde:ferredoxin oxidoreductase
MGDILGMCKTLIPWGPMHSFETCAQLLALATGEPHSEPTLRQAAGRTLLLERAFNALRGLRSKDERLPARLFEQPVAHGPYAGQILDRQPFEEMRAHYYRLRDWDHDGVPTPAAFEHVGLPDGWDAFQARLNGKKGSRTNEDHAECSCEA